MKKTKIWYTANGIPQYDEFLDFLPDCFGYKAITSYEGPKDLFYLLQPGNSGYKLSRDDGPALEYWDNILIFNSSKRSNISFGHAGYCHYLGIDDFILDTKHLLCKVCKTFCKQKCFA